MRHTCLPSNHVIRPFGRLKLVFHLRHHASLKPFLTWPRGTCFKICFSVENIIIVSLNTVIPNIAIVYEGCSNMSASSFITFFLYMLRQNSIPFWKEQFVAFKMAHNIKKHLLYFLSYRRIYKGNACTVKFF